MFFKGDLRVIFFGFFIQKHFKFCRMMFKKLVPEDRANEALNTL